MRKPLGSAIILLLLLWSRGETSPVGGHSTCETSGTVFDGDPATVTCHFHRPHEKFMVYRLRASLKKEQEIVVVCTHTESGHECNSPDGHKVTASLAKDQATVHIASARQGNSGTYFCKTLPARDDHASNCTLIVQSNTRRKGNLVSCKTNPPVSLGQNTWLSCNISKIAGSTGISLVKQSNEDRTVSEEIVTCDKHGECKVKKTGYEIVENNKTHIKIGIPQLTNDHTGYYECKSATLKGITHGCQLQTILGHAEVDSGGSPWTYASYGALVGVLAVILLCVVLYFVYKARSRNYEGVTT